MLVITIHNTSQLLFVKTIKTKPIVLLPILVCDVLSSFDGSDIPIWRKRFRLGQHAPKYKQIQWIDPLDKQAI